MNSKSAELMGRELAAIVKDAIKPLNTKIEAMEAEIRHGHARIRELEAMRGGNND